MAYLNLLKWLNILDNYFAIKWWADINFNILHPFNDFATFEEFIHCQRVICRRKFNRKNDIEYTLFFSIRKYHFFQLAMIQYSILKILRNDRFKSRMKIPSDKSTTHIQTTFAINSKHLLKLVNSTFGRISDRLLKQSNIKSIWIYWNYLRYHCALSDTIVLAIHKKT